MYLFMKDEAIIKSKHKRKFLLKFLLQQKLDQTNRTYIKNHNVLRSIKEDGKSSGFKSDFHFGSLAMSKLEI